MIFIKSRRFFKWFTKPWVSGIALFPFILYRDDDVIQNHPGFVTHELIHIRQQLELLVLPFFVWYGIEYLVRLIQYKDAYKAYRNISFEREAYANEGITDYLQKRPFWRFLRYL